MPGLLVIKTAARASPISKSHPQGRVETSSIHCCFTVDFSNTHWGLLLSISDAVGSFSPHPKGGNWPQGWRRDAVVNFSNASREENSQKMIPPALKCAIVATLHAIHAGTITYLRVTLPEVWPLIRKK